MTDPIDAALVLGATMRLTRAVVLDDVGQWWVRDPLDALFHRHPALMRHHKYLSGLVCPHCVGFYIGAGVLAVTVATRPDSVSGRAWRFTMTALTLNVLVPQLGRAMDYWSGGEDDA